MLITGRGEEIHLDFRSHGESNLMKAFVENTISLFKAGVAPMHESAYERSRRIVLSGYSPAHDNAESSLSSRKHVGILYADVADYTRLSEQDETGTHLCLVESMKTMQAHIKSNKGRVAHFAGDAVLAEFVDARSALHCAIDMQLDARKYNANLPLNRRVLFRIGVNYGAVISDHGDIYGNAVNLAARLENLACTGGICVSESVRSKLEASTEFQFVALGKQYVKNIREPVQAFWIEIEAQESAPGMLGSPAVAV
jgi:class 3 adenylate cyclase